MTTRTTKKSVGKRSAAKSRAGAKRNTSARKIKTGGLKIRMYRVGFGDFFLVTVPTRAGNQYILIDCGVFKGTSGTGDIGSIVEAVEDMYQTTNGRLALVIMTHRHADHIAGFAKAERFKDFTAGMVWMPYWEQFNDKKDSPHNLQFDIGELAAKLAMLFRGREDDDAKEALAQLSNATGIENFSAAATEKKKGGGGNAKALDVLKNHLGENGKKVRYYAANDKPELPSELVGLTARILGPPPQDASAFMALTDLKKGVGQYLDSLTDEDELPKEFHPFPDEWGAHERDYPSQDRLGRAIDYNGIKQKVEDSQPDMLAAAAGKIETFLNNQSLVVLFEFSGKKLLFAGDAQAGNWEYWLFKTKGPVKDPTKAGEMLEASKELLQSIDFYKVGHHGSTNATPIQAVEAAVSRAKSSKGFVSMCSTEFGVYGNPDKGTEVPRSPLMKALADGCSLIRSDSFAITVTDPAKKIIKPAKGVDTTIPTPKTGKLTKANLYIEYSF